LTWEKKKEKRKRRKKIKDKRKKKKNIKGVAVRLVEVSRNTKPFYKERKFP